MRRLMKRFPYRPQNPRIVLNVPKRTLRQKINNWFRRLLLVLGALSLLSIMLTGIGVYRAIEENGPLSLPDEFVVAHKFERGFPEAQEFSGLGLPVPTPTFYDFLTTLEKAQKDSRVKGLVVRIEDGAYSLPQVQEIRQAVLDFRSSGKFAYAMSSSFGDFSNGMAEYYLATAFDEIWLQPVGNVSINGFMAEIPFVRDLLKKIGVKPEFYTREDYKSAMETFTNSEISPQSRETTESIIGVFSDQLINDIGTARNLDIKQIKALVDNSPLTAEEAKEAGLIDEVKYSDELLDKIIFEVTGDKENDLELVGLFNYQKSIESDVGKASEYIKNQIDKNKKKVNVGLINLVGMIVPGTARSSQFSVTSGQQVIFADDVIPTIYDLADDEEIEAIVVRLDSPGGSPTASETIRRALSYAREEKKKKIIVSMGGVAASGGYWIASTADHIVANPTTITGSIGVVAGKVDVSELLGKIGINIESISYGENADFWSVTGAFDPKGEEKINQLLDNIYNDFLARVSAGRDMPIDKVREIARGRAWTGVEAEAVGLVDTLGGLNDALEKTAEILGAFDRHDLSIEVYPKAKTPLEVVMEILQGGEVRSANSSLTAMSEILAPANDIYVQARYPEYFAAHAFAVSLSQ